MYKRKAMLMRGLRRYEIVLLAACLALGIFAMFSGTERPAFVSSEARFTESAKLGLNVVPASCASNPHYSGECSTPFGGGCTISASPSLVSSGQSALLSWNVNDQANALGLTSSIASITLTGVGTVARSGTQTVTPSVTTTYTLSGSYVFAGVPSGNFSCSASVSVGGCTGGTVLVNGQCVYQCPTGQHAVGQTCICDDTNAPPNSAGQCTEQACPSGWQWDSSTGQCVRVVQCSAPPVCSDSTHVLNQCTGQTLDCTLNGPGWSCVNGACRSPEPPTATITAVPSLIPPNRTSDITWSSQNTSSCLVSGSNGDGGTGWSGTTGSHTSSLLVSQTIYSLVCQGFDGSTITKTATVNIIPNWQEQ